MQKRNGSREVALVGTVNMDYRSFHLQVQSAALCSITCPPAVEELFEDMDEIVGCSVPYTQRIRSSAPGAAKAIETVLRLFAIWM